MLAVSLSQQWMFCFRSMLMWYFQLLKRGTFSVLIVCYVATPHAPGMPGVPRISTSPTLQNLIILYTCLRLSLSLATVSFPLPLRHLLFSLAPCCLSNQWQKPWSDKSTGKFKDWPDLSYYSPLVWSLYCCWGGSVYTNMSEAQLVYCLMDVPSSVVKPALTLNTNKHHLGSFTKQQLI